MNDLTTVPVFVLMDDVGDYCACDQNDDWAARAEEAGLNAGWRVVCVNVTMRAPLSGEEMPTKAPQITVPDDATASVTVA